jgi:O-antigen/teichoic acid export membrane protein
MFERILKNSAALLGSTIFGSILALLTLSVLTKNFSVSAVGGYLLVRGIYEFIASFLSVQSWQYLLKLFIDDEEKGKNKSLFVFFLTFDLLLSILVIALMMTLNGLILVIFDIQEWSQVVFIFSFMPLVLIGHISYAVFRYKNKFKFQAFFEVLQALLIFFISLVTIYFQYDIYWFSICVMSSLLFIALLQVLVASIIMNIRYENLFDIFNTIKFVNTSYSRNFLMYNYFDTSIRLISRKLDIIIIGYLLSTSSVAIYQIAVRCANILGKLSNPIYQTIYPEFTRLLKENKKYELMGLIKKLTTYLIALCVICYCVFILIGKYLLIHAFGADYESSYPQVMIYLFAVIISTISLPLAPLYMSAGLTKLASFNQLVATLFYLMFLYWLIVFFGLYGATLSYVIFYLIWVWLSVRGLLKINYFR